MQQQNEASCWGAARWTLCAFAGVLLIFFLTSNPDSPSGQASIAVVAE